MNFKSSSWLGIVVVCILFHTTIANGAPAFQPIRVPKGTYSLLAKGAAKQLPNGRYLARLPGSCVDSAVKAPETKDIFKGSSGLSVTYNQGGKKITKSLDDAIKDETILIRGANSTSAIEIEFKDLGPDADLRIVADDIAVVGEKADIANQYSALIKDNPAAKAIVTHLDEQYEQLRKLGDADPLVATIRRIAQAFEWEALDEKPNPAVLLRAYKLEVRHKIISLGGNNGPFDRDLAELTLGRRLSDEHVSLIKRLTDVEVPPRTGKFDSHAIVDYNVSGKECRVRTVREETTFDLAGLTKENADRVFGQNPTIVVNELEPNLIRGLANVGTRVFRTYDHFIESPQLPYKQARIIFVGSDNLATAKKLFPGQDPAAVVRAAKSAKSKGMSVVDKKQQLQAAIDAAIAADETPIIFHNKTDQIVELFDGEFERNDVIRLVDGDILVDDVVGEAHRISCELFQPREFGWGTTQKLDLEASIEAFSKASADMKTAAGGGGGKKPPFDDFYRSWNRHYQEVDERLVGKRARRIVTLLGVVGTGAAGAVKLLIDDDDDDDDAGQDQKKEEPKGEKQGKTK